MFALTKYDTSQLSFLDTKRKVHTYISPLISVFQEYLREQRQRIGNYKRYYVNHDAASLAFIGKPPDIPFRLLQTLLKTVNFFFNNFVK